MNFSRLWESTSARSKDESTVINYFHKTIDICKSSKPFVIFVLIEKGVWMRSSKEHLGFHKLEVTDFSSVSYTKSTKKLTMEVSFTPLDVHDPSNVIQIGNTRMVLGPRMMRTMRSHL